MPCPTPVPVPFSQHSARISAEPAVLINLSVAGRHRIHMVEQEPALPSFISAAVSHPNRRTNISAFVVFSDFDQRPARTGSEKILQHRDQRLVGGRHVVVAETLGPHPGEPLPLLGRRRAMPAAAAIERHQRSEEHTSELQSLMRISYAVFSL